MPCAAGPSCSFFYGHPRDGPFCSSCMKLERLSFDEQVDLQVRERLENIIVGLEMREDIQFLDTEWCMPGCMLSHVRFESFCSQLGEYVCERWQDQQGVLGTSSDSIQWQDYCSMRSAFSHRPKPAGSSTRSKVISCQQTRAIGNVEPPSTVCSPCQFALAASPTGRRARVRTPHAGA